ncbi:Glutathionyl-hydroquinone reductase YqjG [Mizuhopecten yessoensis]|uniref:Glutathionyl-hydroquinone reductase YqjG n=1 Tax=Mizuhopecten yessoensis TaxID=6573 RepID=A0A210Q1Z9_MIZYE|nr:Glutathionyl-hydroquinone reductase YqjG [Mizuhopecten yessoensis]
MRLDYDGRVRVPVLWDKQKSAIVNNESSEIILMLNSEFNDFCATEEQRKLDLYQQSLRKDIDEVNEMINNGVYKSGFAASQEVYDVAVRELFQGLDKAEEILSKSRYLTGNQLTEADVRLVTTLFRFDLVYVGHFKGSPIMAKINPNGIVSVGPVIDFTSPHGQETMG